MSEGEERPVGLLVGSYLSGGKEECEEHLDELAALAQTVGIEVGEKVACPLRSVDRATLIGSGKLSELKAVASGIGAQVVIFDDELTPSQQRNLERQFNLLVLERTEVILDIFRDHARTREAKLQVELARVRYEAPRLKRLWTHLSRQHGGGVYLKGAGEKQIELDRRLLARRAARLTRELEEVRQVRRTQRKARENRAIPIFALVGYTNAGKSSLLNALTSAHVLVEDQLFATLDTTTRRFLLPNHQAVLLIDTVGFIRKIPHMLIHAFRSTLEEVTTADLLLHVVDLSHPSAREQAEATLEVLDEIGAGGIPIITVLNKIDDCTPENESVANHLRLVYPRTVRLSARTGEGIRELQERMMDVLSELRIEVRVRIPQAEYGRVAELMREGEILSQEYEGQEILLHARIPRSILSHFEAYQVED